jgi:hypothetical protein
VIWRLIRRWHLRGQILEHELALKAARKARDEFPLVEYFYNTKIAQLKQSLERAGAGRAPRASSLLSGRTTNGANAWQQKNGCTWSRNTAKTARD